MAIIQTFLFFISRWIELCGSVSWESTHTRDPRKTLCFKTGKIISWYIHSPSETTPNCNNSTQFPHHRSWDNPIYQPHTRFLWRKSGFDFKISIADEAIFSLLQGNGLRTQKPTRQKSVFSLKPHDAKSSTKIAIKWIIFTWSHRIYFHKAIFCHQDIY